MSDGEVQRWADVAMWHAPKHEDPQKPKVTLTMAPANPFGVMAMINGMYTGKIITNPYSTTREEQARAWEDFFKSKLSETPAEWFQVSLLFENVTRAFTHQLVRTRLATYAQESMRFAVKEDAKDAVKLPPSIAATTGGDTLGAERNMAEWQRNVWDQAVQQMHEAYLHLVASGMPAEDARGLLPTNILTRVHMRTDIKTLLNMAGSRLCTQAQFEWREVFAQVANAFRTYNPYAAMDLSDTVEVNDSYEKEAWQWDTIANSFRPVCYRAGKCVVNASADRTCSIRNRVDANAEVGRPSDQWLDEMDNVKDNPIVSGVGPQSVVRDEENKPVFIGAIHAVEWLADPTAARRGPRD